MIEWIKGKIKKVWEKIKFHWKLRRADKLWYELGGSCFGLFPPSFYYRHTEEEIKRIEKEEIDKLKEIVNEFQRRHEESEKAL